MWGIFESVSDLASKTVRIASAPVEIALDAANAITKPISDAAQEIADEVKEELEDE